jgi:hypothetical protein
MDLRPGRCRAAGLLCQIATLRSEGIMFPVWFDLSSSQLLQWGSALFVLFVCLVNLATGQHRNV